MNRFVNMASESFLFTPSPFSRWYVLMRGANNFFDIFSCASFRNCKFSHDIPAYLAAKTHDIRVLESSEISDNAPFVEIDRPVREHVDHPSIDQSTTCPIFTETGECRLVRGIVFVQRGKVY